MRLSATDVCHAVGQTRLICGVNLDAGAGDLVGLVGPNGAGKSTLLRLLAGELLPGTGTIAYDGVSPSTLSVGRLARTRAVLGQRQADDVAFTVADVVAMGRYAYRNDPAYTREEHRRVVDRALHTLDLEGFEHRPVSSLSGGERQRVAIARTLAQDTELVLLDEPTTALDLGHQQMVLGIMRALASAGRTVVAVLHDLTMATEFDHIMVLDAGTVSAYGPARVVLTSERLTRVYDHPIAVVDHPLGSGRLILPVPPD